MGNPRTYHFTLPPWVGAPLPEPPGAWYPGVQAHWPACTTDRRRHGDGRVRAVVIHATAGSSSAGAMSVLFAHRASWHWLVPDENEPEHGRGVWACVPERRAAWHVRPTCSHPDVNGGRRHVNAWSLGIEVVNSQQGSDAFSDWQVEQTAALVRYAWSKYPDLVDVVSHAKLDPERRTDPGAHFPWERFRELVLAAPTVVAAAPSAAFLPGGPIRVVGPDGARIECDARLEEGVTVVEARPLVEALGFTVSYDDGPPMTMRVHAAEPPARKATRKTTRKAAKRTARKATTSTRKATARTTTKRAGARTR